MLPEVLKDHDEIVISTGNVLSGVTKKAGQKPTEELIDCLKLALENPLVLNADKGTKIPKLTRQNDDLAAKIGEHDRCNVKIGAKIFLNRNCECNLKAAIDNLFKTLDIEYLDNLILAYHPKSNGKIIQNGDGDHPRTNGEGMIEWGGGEAGALNDLKKVWKHLEKYSLEKKIEQLGIADLDYESLKDLYSNCEVYPTIAQINLSTCCVVPPPLQSFCNEKDIQLLTHSDPEEILTLSTLNNELNVEDHQPAWVIRYQVHVKCRGLLTAKGFIVGVERKK